MSDSQTDASPAKPVLLIVDDSKLVRVTIKRVLKNEFTIEEAADGEDGWEKLLANPDIRIVITDAGMPRLDGFQLIERIRRSDDHRIKDIPVMMVTGVEKAQTDIREKALALGATDFLTKPFDDVQMLARARTHAKLDATARTLEKTTHELEETSALDPLTQTNSRRYFLQHGAQALSFAQRHKQALAFIGIGIDQFDSIKSQYGEKTGGQIQVWLAKELQPILRKEDTIARIADGLFAIIAPSASRMDAAVLAERMRKAVQAAPFTETVIALPVSISLGIACMENAGAGTVDAYINTLVQLVQQAQNKGGNRTLAAATKSPSPEADSIPRPSIAAALELLAQNDIGAIEPFLNNLAQQVLPLLELCNRTYHWQADEHIAFIKQKLDGK